MDRRAAESDGSRPPLTGHGGAAATGEHPAPPTGRAPRTPWQWWWLAIGWLALAAVAVGFAIRSVAVASPLLVALASLAPFTVVPAAVALVVAWPARSRVLTGVSVFTAVVWLVTFVSPAAVIGCGPDEVDEPIVVHVHNVRFRQGQPSEVAAAVAAADADIVVLQEVWAPFLDRLGADQRLDPYRFRASEPVTGTTGLAVWSRHPLSDATIEIIGRVPFLRVTVDHVHGPFDLVAIHTSAPVSDALANDWDEQFRQLTTIDTSSPLVLAGDFNATADHRQFRQLLGVGFTDAHDPKGCGLGATWPAEAPLPPLLRLDHVLVTDHFRVGALDLGPPGGSDHLPVTVTLDLVDPADPASSTDR